MEIIIKGPLLGKASECKPILHSLPEWFGIEESNAQYLADIDMLSTFLAFVDKNPVGFLAAKQHNKYAAEIHIIGVFPDLHRNGIGRTLLTKTEEFLRQNGTEYLQVKTLSSSHPSEEYARTRAFYMGMGFRPLEEFKELWNEENPCLLMVKSLI